MTYAFCRKTALIALVILLVACCVFFACACEKSTVTVDLSFNEELVAGESYSFQVTFTGKEALVAEYSEKACAFEVVSGADVVSVENNKLKIAESAHKDDAFSVRLTVGDIVLVKDFVVAADAPVVIESVTLSLPERAEAGEVISLSAVILPEGVNVLPVYTVVSGSATVAGNLLKIAEDADSGEVVVKATAAGVSSEEKKLTISTVQTRVLTLSLSKYRALPGESVEYLLTKEPEESSFPVTLTLSKGGESASLDQEWNTLLIDENAAMGTEILLVATSGRKRAEATLVVGYPLAEEILVNGGIVQPDNSLRQIEYTVLPAAADASSLTITLVEGEDYVEWTGGDTFRVLAGSPADGEITFLLECDDIYNTVTYRIGRKVLTSLSIGTSDPTEYLRSGRSVTFSHTTVPADVDQPIYYRATAGADLVTISGNVMTVKAGADIGEVTVVAESEDGTLSNEVTVTVSGRYVRREYDSWASVGLAASGESSCVWMVLPSVMNAGSMTLIVPYNVVDLVLEGRYDGTEQSAYKDLYFYFRNTAQRSVTLWNFGTIATQGLGGTVMDLGSSGETEIVLKGQNLVRADSPYYLDNSGEAVDGVWANGYSIDAQKQARRVGKPGYRGASGGTALSGYSLTFTGDGTLIAEAGSGVNGTPGGNGADAVYDGSFSYLSGAGGAGGNGGDSGSAIYAYRAKFLSGFVTALSGNAGLGGAGGAAGSLTALAGYDVTKTMGAAGARGEDGMPYAAINVKTVTGTKYLSSVGEVKSSDTAYVGSLADLTDRLARFYGIELYYGTQLENPYANVFPRRNRYTMKQQLDATVLMQQANFLMYTMSMMPKNCWNEINFRSGKIVKIYLCKSINSSSSVILGLTNKDNQVWFATFETDLRGVMYSGYFNIMLHEFVHVFHFNFTSSARSAFETKLAKENGSLSYGNSNSAEGVYGLTAANTAESSCFFTSYSRKSEMEDASETISIAATFSAAVDPLAGDTPLKRKVTLLAEAFSREYETLAPFITGKVLFGDRRAA